MDPANHDATSERFSFMIDSRMASAVVNPQRPGRGTYYRAIEYGDTSSMGRRLPRAFLGGNVNNPVSTDAHYAAYYARQRAAAGAPAAPVRGPSAYVTVRQPIRAYHYAAFARDQFLAGNFRFYRSLIEREAARTGVKVKITAGR